MVSYVDRHVQNELFILHGVLGEFLRAQSALKGHCTTQVVIGGVDLLICSKWLLTSVDNIILIMIYLTFQYYASLSNSNMSFDGSNNSLKPMAQ